MRPGDDLYEGMIIGLNSRREDMEMNIIRFKKLTNMHTENSDVAITLDTPLRLSLEQCLDFPSPLSHDDLPDSLSYIDQISQTMPVLENLSDQWRAVDDLVGF